jgi:hypothetical protein
MSRGGVPTPAPEHDSHDARRLGRKLEPARGGEAQGTDLAHDADKPGTAHVLVRHRHNLGIPPGLGIDHPVGMQARAGQRRREQVARGQAPQHPPLELREDAGREHPEVRQLVLVSS